MFCRDSFYMSETKGIGNSLTTISKQSHNRIQSIMGASVPPASRHLQKWRGKEGTGLGELSGQPTGQRHSAKYSGFSTGNRISFPRQIYSDLYMALV